MIGSIIQLHIISASFNPTQASLVHAGIQHSINTMPMTPTQYISNHWHQPHIITTADTASHNTQVPNTPQQTSHSIIQQSYTHSHNHNQITHITAD